MNLPPETPRARSTKWIVFLAVVFAIVAIVFVALMFLPLYQSTGAPPMPHKITIDDNRDYMAVITTDRHDLLQNLKDNHTLKALHPLGNGSWLARLRISDDSVLLKTLRDSGSTFRVVFTRFTARSAYRSSDTADEAAGKQITDF
jgi:hypothetical protein